MTPLLHLLDAILSAYIACSVLAAAVLLAIFTLLWILAQ